MIKYLKEYKSNLYSGILMAIVSNFAFIAFFYIISNQFSDLLPWSFGDFYIFFLLLYIINGFAGFVIWREFLYITITKGDFNNYLTKPTNIFFLYLFNKISPNPIIYMSVNLVFLIFGIFYFSIELHNIFLFLLFSVFLIVFISLVYFFLLSLDFLKLRLGEYAISSFFKVDILFHSYPFIFFERFEYKNFLFIFPFVFVSSILVPTLRDYTIYDLLYQLTFLIVASFILLLGIIFLWKYGLKRYEAFG
jgi:ABC-type uncharacterized transport system permease subunit